MLYIKISKPLFEIVTILHYMTIIFPCYWS